MRVWCLLSGLLCSAMAWAAPVAVPATYVVGDVTHEGYWVYEDSEPTPRPLVVMVPNWLGVTPRALEKAAVVAGRDYVVFVADMYGVGRRTADPEAAGAAVGRLYADRPELRHRVNAAVDAALASAEPHPVLIDKLAAVGFCFGGASVLELARGGRAVAGVVSFHGNLSLAAEAPAPTFRTRILALHGAVDPYVPAAEVAAFEAEMTANEVDWQLIKYGGAVHSFTDPTANLVGQAQYDARIATRAYAAMREFLNEAFESY